MGLPIKSKVQIFICVHSIFRISNCQSAAVISRNSFDPKRTTVSSDSLVPLIECFYEQEVEQISYKLLKTNVEVADINYCNSSVSFEGAMKPGMLCAGRIREGSFIISSDTEIRNPNQGKMKIIFSKEPRKVLNFTA